MSNQNKLLTMKPEQLAAAVVKAIAYLRTQTADPRILATLDQMHTQVEALAYLSDVKSGEIAKLNATLADERTYRDLLVKMELEDAVAEEILKHVFSEVRAS